MQAPVEDSECSGARCVEQAEAALYYKDYDKAREPLTRVCDGGDGFACFRLAELYQQGQGVPADPARAAALYEASCTYKHPEGCERRYELAQQGQGDPTLELDFALKACEGGRPNGCMHAAEQVKAGRGVPPDPLRIVQAFQKACALGEITGCTGAGDLLSAPDAPPEAAPQALTAFIRACTGHSGYGCLRVGVAFHEGIGAPRDLVKAQAHFSRACDYSEPDGCRAVEMLAAANGQKITLELSTRAARIEQGGLDARAVACRMPEQGLAILEDVVSHLARHKKALDACTPEGSATRVTWEFTKGRITDVRVADKVDKKISGCIGGILRKSRMPGAGTCDAVLLLGDATGAEIMITARTEKEAKARAKGDGRKHIRIGADSE